MSVAGGEEKGDEGPVGVRCEDCGNEVNGNLGAPAVCGSCGDLRMILRFPELNDVLTGDAMWDAVPVIDALTASYLRGEAVPERIEDLSAWLRDRASAGREGVRRFETQAGVQVICASYPVLEGAAGEIDAWLARRTARRAGIPGVGGRRRKKRRG